MTIIKKGNEIEYLSSNQAEIGFRFISNSKYLRFWMNRYESFFHSPPILFNYENNK